MNTHDKIELPPLPPADRYFEFDSHRMKASIDIPYWGEKSLEAYARAVVEADRQSRGEPVVCFKCGHSKHGGECVNVAPQPAEPVNKTDWSAELSSWSDEDFIQVFHERPDLANRLRKMLAEPVKVPSDEEVLKIAINSGLAFRDSTGEVLCAWREDADISEYLVEFARALLARYSHLTATTHKSSNQNQLKG